MRKQEKKKIGDTLYHVTMMGPDPAMDLAADVGNLIGPAIGAAVGGVLGQGGSLTNFAELDLSDLKLDFVGNAISALLTGLDKKRMKGIFALMAQHTVVGADAESALRLADIYDDHFSEKRGELFPWLGFAIGVQLGGFFGDFLNAALKAAAKGKVPLAA